MGCKFFFIVLSLCFFEEFALGSQNEVSSYDIPYDELDGIDSFSEFFTLKSLELKLKSNKKFHAGKCYMQYNSFYIQLTTTFARELEILVKEFEKKFSNETEIYKDLLNSLILLGELVQSCGYKLESFLQKQNYYDAVKYLQTFKQELEEYQIDFFRSIKQLNSEDSKSHITLAKKFKMIRQNAKNKSKHFGVTLQKCFKAKIIWS